MYACIHVPGLPEDKRPLLRACAGAFAPKIEHTASDLVVLDARGMGKLIGEASRIAAAIAQRAATLGLAARVAVAANPAVARAAARGCEGITVIPAGEEARRLGPLPLDLLDMSDELRDTFADWGIRRFADLAALPEDTIVERLGEEGARLHRAVRGLSSRPLVPEAEAASFEESLELEHPLALLEPLSFLLSRFLNDICARLKSHGLATNEIEVRLGLEGGGGHERRLCLPFAGREPGAFLKLLQLDLAAHPPPAAIVSVALRVKPVQPRNVQGGLFLPAAPEPEKLELTLARIAGMVGEENAGTPELLDSHRPHAFRMRKFAARPSAAPAGRAGAPCLAMRLFRPPLPAQVATQSGCPQRLQARGIAGRVATHAGPWRVSGDWWCGENWAREEWDVALENGALYRIYREAGGWFVEGNYD